MGGGLPKGISIKRQFSHSFDDIISVENLLLAWQEFICGKRMKQDVQEFALHLMDNILALYADLAQLNYAHGVYQHFRIADPKPRDIHKASVRDRLLHHALYRQLYPFFDCLFIADSFSCRTGKGTHKALERFKYFSNSVSKNTTKTVWVLKGDIKKFFANINHSILISLLQKHIKDQNLLSLLENIISSFSVSPGKGLPLGNLTSQLLVNI